MSQGSRLPPSCWLVHLRVVNKMDAMVYFQWVKETFLHVFQRSRTHACIMLEFCGKCDYCKGLWHEATCRRLGGAKEKPWSHRKSPPRAELPSHCRGTIFYPQMSSLSLWHLGLPRSDCAFQQRNISVCTAQASLQPLMKPVFDGLHR